MRSMGTGFTEMCALVNDFDFDVFGVSETWLLPDTPSDNFKITGYTMLRCDRYAPSLVNDGNEEAGGGVAIYIREDITFDQHIFAGLLEPGVEALCVVLRVKGQRIGLCVGYRPPNVRYSSLASLFHSLFVELAVEVKMVVFLGDTNIDLVSKTSNESKFFRRLLKDTNTVQLIKEPTRVTASSATLLDHIIVDRSAEVRRTGVIDASSIKDHRGVKITDHKLVYCEIDCKKVEKRAKLITYRDFSKFDINSAVHEMAGIDWDSILDLRGADTIERDLTSKIRNVYDKHAPMVCKRVTKKKAPWRNNEIKVLSKTKNKLRKKYTRTRHHDDWESYKNVRNRLNVLIWREKKSYFSQKLSSADNPKDFWSSLKQCGIVGGGDDCNLPQEINIDEMNKYFVDMGTGSNVDKDTVSDFKSTRQDCITNCFTFTNVSENTVKEAMNKIKSTALGCDDISIQMLVAVSPYALKAITHLINESLSSGVFPKAWKLSVVRPLPKVTTPSNVQDLRPISILPALSKILEKIVTNQMSMYIETENLLPKQQSGFRKNYSTCSALTNMFSDMIDDKDKGRYSSLVLLDYSKAFDSINHDMLLAKMYSYNFSDKVISWMRSYLGDRLQVTRLGSETSKPLVKNLGVPQGSCLGPILFNLYTADFVKRLQHCSAHLYADDSQLHLSYEPRSMLSAIDQLNSDLDKVSRWSVINGLKLNLDKCVVVHVAPHAAVQALDEMGVGVSLDGRRLTVCDRVKTLGVVLDSGLTFSDHVTYASQRALGRLRGMYRFRSLLPESAKLRLMQSLILSVFHYCYPAYGNSICREDTERIQKIQNTAIRFVFNLRRYDHVTPFRQAVNLLPMETTCRILTCCMTHKVLKLGEPQYLGERLSFREEVSQRSTRHGNKLNFPRVRLEAGRRSYSYFGPVLYNDLPDDLKHLSCTTFKAKLKKLISNSGIH